MWALPGSSYDGHTLETIIPDMEALIGNIIALFSTMLSPRQCATRLQVQGLHLRAEAYPSELEHDVFIWKHSLSF